MISREFITNLKQKTNIVELAHSLGLTEHSSAQEVRGLCPMKHESKSKACCLYSNNSNLYYCYSCKNWGDSIELVSAVKFGSTSKDSFMESVKYLADRASIKIDNQISDTLLFEHSKNRRTIDCLTAAIEEYHNQLTPRWYEWLEKKYGFTGETIRRFRIGFAESSSGKCKLFSLLLNRGFSQEEILSTGLYILTKTGARLPFLNQRIVFPYLEKHRCRYLIGRKTELTPDKPYEESKYKKLLTYEAASRNYVSPIIDNSYIFNQSEIFGASEVIITEGIADCIALSQAGFCSISPVTTQFSKKDIEMVKCLLDKKQTIFICNDNELNMRGEAGALAMANDLTLSGFVVKLIKLPLEERQKYARAEYESIAREIERRRS